jgi:hypothetical protein
MKIHRHDYDMTFIGDSLDYRMVCSCGDVARSDEEAMWKQGQLVVGGRTVPWEGMVVTVLVALAVLVVWWTWP